MTPLLRVRPMSGLFLTLCLGVSAAGAQTLPPTVAASGSGFALSVPYLEFGSGSQRAAYRVTLDSSNLLQWQVRSGSVGTTTLGTFTVGVTPSLTAGTASYALNVPYLEYTAAGVTKAYSVRLDSADLSRFNLNLAALQEVNVVATVGAPTGLTLAAVNSQTVAGRSIASSTQLAANWMAPSGAAVHHYEISASDAVAGTVVRASTTGLSHTLTGLKAATAYTVSVVACSDAACTRSSSATTASSTLPTEYWQLQGTGNTTAGLTRIVSDGNVRISATRFGPDAGTANAGFVQLYYGPNGQTSRQQALTTAITATAATATNPSSYLSFTGSGATTGLITPSTASTAVKQVATGQGVPLSSALGSKLRLFFEAQGADGKTRIYWLDSVDGYVGQDFNSGSARTCSTQADYDSGGGCVPTLAVGVEGDAAGANAKISNARQNKVGFPVLDDWRWQGEAGTFMVFTTDQVPGCSTSGMNHGYAVWSGSRWAVQYASDGCPKLFKSAQAAFPMHLGGARYKLYYGDPSVTTGKLTSSSLPFLGPKKLIYADGARSGQTSVVDFEDWEAQSTARDVAFLWPNGELMDAAAEGYIDDYHFLAPTGSLDLQVMYLAITNGTEVPFGGAAVLLNP